MSNNVCPNCKSEINAEDKICKSCGFYLNNHKTNMNDIKSNFINFTEDIASKIQNTMKNKDMIRTNDIKETIKNLDEHSFNKLLDKYDISPSKLKMPDFNKLLNKVDITKLKEDLIEFGIINPKSNSDTSTEKTKIIIDDEPKNADSQEPDVPFVEKDEVKEEPQNNETPEPPKVESPKINVCSKCGFENRSNAKFCTNCGNKL